MSGQAGGVARTVPRGSRGGECVMGYFVLTVAALIAAFALPMIFGAAGWALIASHLCILTVTIAMFFGVLRLKKDEGPK